MQETMRVKTSQEFEVVDLTAKVADAGGRSGVVEGRRTVFVRHATAAIVINENADAGFRHDIIAALDKLFPQGVWQHDKVDDNGAAHLKAAVLGPSEAIPIGGGRRSEEHTSELQSPYDLVCRLLLEKKKKRTKKNTRYIQQPITHTQSYNHTIYSNPP